MDISKFLFSGITGELIYREILIALLPENNPKEGREEAPG
jgi:hypothetical protein